MATPTSDWKTFLLGLGFREEVNHDKLTIQKLVQKKTSPSGLIAAKPKNDWDGWLASAQITDEDHRTAIVAGLLQLQAPPPGNHGGTASSLPADLTQTMESVHQFLGSVMTPLISTASNIKLPQFLPRSNHPFYNTIQAANIPATLLGKPDLLLYSLPFQKPPTLEEIKVSAEANNPFADADLEVELETSDDPLRMLRDPTRRVLELGSTMMNAQLASKVITLIGVSGCGKTRTLVEVASIQYGLYFVASTGGNGGSIDMEKMLEKLADALRNPANNAEATGTHYLHALLLARLLVLRYFIDNAKAERSIDLPYYWLLLQYRPALLRTPDGSDMFLTVFNRIVKCSPSAITQSLEELLSQFHLQQNAPLFIFCDESQLLFNSCKGRFEGLTTQESRSVFSKLVSSWARLQQAVLVLAGTGLRLRESLKLVASAILKTEADLFPCLVTDFDLYDELEQMQTYLNNFFLIPREIMPQIFSRITGRNRNSATYAILVLTNATATDGSALLTESIDQITDLSCSAIHQDSPLSLRNVLVRLHKENLQNALYILATIRTLTLSYYYLGKAYAFMSERSLELVEQGMCPLKRAANTLMTCISEPLVAWACYCFFKDIGQPIEEEFLGHMAAYQIIPSSLGLMIERFLIPAIIKYFDGVIDQTEYFQRVFQVQILRNQLPAWIVGARLDVPNLQKSVDSNWLENASSTTTFVEFLTKESPADVYCPHPHLRKDAVCRLKTSQNEIHMGLMEFKFRKEMSNHLANQAIASTDYKNIARNSRKRNYTAIATMESKYHAKEGTLRIIFLYPAAGEKVESKISGNDVIVILDSLWARKLLKPEVWNMFAALKLRCDEIA